MDARLTPFSGRIAHVSLQGRVAAERFTEGTPATVVPDCADLLAAPDPAPRSILRQLRMGDRVTVLEWRGGYAYVMAARDGYCGWLRAAWLSDTVAEPTHVLATRASHLYPVPEMKASGSVIAVSLGARLRVTGQEGRFARVALPRPAPAPRPDGGQAPARPAERYIPLSHLRPLSEPERDPVAVAERLLGTPYLWGGNGGAGIDCSGLVQLALTLCGQRCPGDSDLQEAALGETMASGTAPRRGDLLFWKGHVAWVADAGRLLHANAHHMAVAQEPLPEALARIAAQGDGEVTRHARLSMAG